MIAEFWWRHSTHELPRSCRRGKPTLGLGKGLSEQPDSPVIAQFAVRPGLAKSSPGDCRLEVSPLGKVVAPPDAKGDDRVVVAIDIRALTTADTRAIPKAFEAIGWPGKTAALYEGYLADQASGSRLVFVAEAARAFAGYVTVGWVSRYRPFADRGIPEIQDLNVLPELWRRGIGRALMDAAEAAIAARTETAGIGVGLYADYAAAHLMYLRRGYLPDGRGLAYRGATVTPGTSVPLDDDLALMMTRRL
jgi:GNAT superfamily N-acetyltransferase